MNLVRLGNAALVFGVIVSTTAGALLIATTPAAAVVVPTASGTSIAWATDHTDTTDPNYENFKNLTVSVSQTKNLVNQGITVSWAGARPTSSLGYATNFMQVMQCWGDADTGPTPEQCQWGAPSATIGNLTGVNVSKRDLVLGDDPAQDPQLVGDAANPDLLLDPPVESPNLRAFRVPFRTVGGTLAKSTAELSKLFDSSTSNEVSAGRTGLNGTGQVAFETQTSLEAPHLGCGADVKAADGSTWPRSCWLVVVPRGELNLDNSLNTTTSSERISGSPLSATAWKERMVVKLDFQPVSQACPIGNAEQRIVGAENITEAITSWQPALCQTGTTYGYSLIGDEEARGQIVSPVEGASRLAIVTDPVDKEAAGDAVLAYAPVAESAIVVAYTIDYRLYPDAKAADRNGLQVENLALSPRLVAKLLTQSYRADVPGRGAASPVITSNPLNILLDPEFLDLNPDFVGSTSDNDPVGLMVALGNSDANALVWSWLRADPLARAFLAGDPDEWGMRVNPAYSALDLANDASVDSFPKADLTTAKSGADVEPGYGTLDMRPYMNDMHEAAIRTLKADPNNKSSWDPFKQPAAYVSLGAQIPGQRFIMSITDAASAARYGLNTARLVNGAGQPTAATPESINKAVTLMADSEQAPGVKVVDPTKRSVGAYPLAMLSYAAVNVCESTKQQLADYSKLISYAAGAGQLSGDARGSLPRGYVPLASEFLKQATSVADDLVSKKAVAKLCPQPEPTPTETPEPTDTPTPVETTPPVVPAPVPSTVEVTPEPTVVPADPEEATPEAQFTVDRPIDGGRAGLAGALVLGIPSMIAGPLLSRRGRKLAKLTDADS